MKLRTIIFTSCATVLLSGVSVWASVERINESKVLNELKDQGIHIPQENKAAARPENNNTAIIPMEKIEELESAPAPPRLPDTTQAPYKQQYKSLDI